MDPGIASKLQQVYLGSERVQYFAVKLISHCGIGG